MNSSTELASDAENQKPIGNSEIRRLAKLVPGPRSKGAEGLGTVLALAGAVVAPLGVSQVAGNISHDESAAAQRIIEHVADGTYPSAEQTQEAASIALEDQIVTPDEIDLIGTTSQEVKLPTETTKALAEAKDDAEKAAQSADVEKEAGALTAIGGTGVASVTVANALNGRKRRS